MKDNVKLGTLKKRYIPSEDAQVTLVTTVTGLNVKGVTDDDSPVPALR